MQTYEFRKSDHHRPSDRDINDGNKDRKTLRCRPGILALTVLNNVLFECRHCFRSTWDRRTNQSEYGSSIASSNSWPCFCCTPPRRHHSSLVQFTTTRWPDGFNFHLHLSPTTNTTQTKRGL